MTKNELRTKLEDHVDSYMIFSGASFGIRKYFRNENWYMNNVRQSITVIHLLNCLFHLVRIRFKNFIWVSEERRNDILERDLDEALLCKDLNKILTEMDT